MTLHGVDIAMEQIEAFCRKWGIARLELFGSILRDDFRPDSDVDVLVTFAPDDRRGLLDVVRAERELGDLLGRNVDLVERPCVEHSENPYRRHHILATARPLYAR